MRIPSAIARLVMVFMLTLPVLAQLPQTCPSWAPSLNVSATVTSGGAPNIFFINAAINTSSTYWMEATIVSNSFRYVAPTSCVSTQVTANATFFGLPPSVSGVSGQPLIASRTRYWAWSVTPGVTSVTLPLKISFQMPVGLPTCTASGATRSITACILIRAFSRPATNTCWSACNRVISLEFRTNALGAVLSQSPQATCW